MGTLDRVIRGILAVVIGILYFTEQITGTATIVLGIVAVIYLVTSTVAFCPFYSLVKLSTIKKTKSS